MNTQKLPINWNAVLIFVSIAFSSQCGGGFESGSTPWTYFLSKGFYGIFGPFLVAIINCFMIYFFMKWAMDHQVYDYHSFETSYTGKFHKICNFLYEVNFNWLTVVCMALAYSTSGSVLHDLFGIPYILTTFIVGIIMLILVYRGDQLVRKNAVVMSLFILVALVAVHVPNLIHNLSSGQLASELSVMYDTTVNSIVPDFKGGWFGYIMYILLWGYVFSGQNLAGFGAYTNHANIFSDKRSLKAAVFISVAINFLFLFIANLNLAANYTSILDGIESGKSVYTIMVVQNGAGSEAVKVILLTLLSLGIFFASISTAINYVAGFNNRMLTLWRTHAKETEEQAAPKERKRRFIITISYVVLTWAVSQVGLTALVSKALTYSALANIATLIIPTIVRVIQGWKDPDYAAMTAEAQQKKAAVKSK